MHPDTACLEFRTSQFSHPPTRCVSAIKYKLPIGMNCREAAPFISEGMQEAYELMLNEIIPLNP